MKRGTPEHPKVYDLAERLKIKRAYAVGYLEMLFHFTSTYAPAGDIGRFSNKRIAAGVDWHGSPDKLIQALVAAGWVDGHPTARLVVHDWHEHADKSTLQRLARAGKMPVQLQQQVTGNLCHQNETTSEHFGNAKHDLEHPPVPEPVPVPDPKPEPTLQSVGGAPVIPIANRGALATEDGFDDFLATATESGMSGSEVDWQEAGMEWRRLDFEQRIRATHGLRQRIGTDDYALRACPQNYLKKRMWQRQVRAPSGANRADAVREAYEQLGGEL